MFGDDRHQNLNHPGDVLGIQPQSLLSVVDQYTIY